MDSRVKSLNTDKRSKKRLRFASSREKAKNASADVYRSYKRQIGGTSAAGREESVHNPSRDKGRRKKRTLNHITAVADERSSKKLNTTIQSPNDNSEGTDNQFDDSGVEVSSSAFAIELDIALDRNASEIFTRFHRQVWALVRSLPEILHYANDIINLLMSYILSPASSPETPSDIAKLDLDRSAETHKEEYVVNHATTDLLHLLAVLARDLRHEIHPYLHTRILPRIIQDLLNPPSLPSESGKQPIPLNVTIVEAAFRTMSYIFRYDSQQIVEDMETMRKYYGTTLAHRRELVRRLSAESFAPLIRMMKSESSRCRHLKRILRALAASESQGTKVSFKKVQDDAIDGISKLVFQIVRGVPGRMHAQGRSILQFLLGMLSKGTGNTENSETSKITKSCTMMWSVASAFLSCLCRHVGDSDFLVVYEEILVALKDVCNAFVTTNSQEPSDGKIDSGFSEVFEMLKLVTQTTSTNSGSTVTVRVGAKQIELLDILTLLCSKDAFSMVPRDKQGETLSLLCSLWKVLHQAPKFDVRLSQCLAGLLASSNSNASTDVEAICARAEVLSEELYPHLPQSFAMKYVGTAILTAASRISQINQLASLRVLFSLATKCPKPNNYAGEITQDALFYATNEAGCSISSIEHKSLLDTCLLDIDYENSTGKDLNRIGVALRVVPFLTVVGHEGDEKAMSNYKRVSKWINQVLDEISKLRGSHVGVGSNDLIVVRSLALQSLSRLSLELSCSQKELPLVKKVLSHTVAAAENLLFSASASVWVVKGVAAFVEALQAFELSFSDKVDELFDALIPNLGCPNHFVRLYTLRILVSYPQKPFVVDHADIDLAGDLDEEPSSYPTKTGFAGLCGPCDVMETLLKLESTPVNLTNERYLLSLVSRIEVLGRSGKIPVIYVEAAANHLQGLFYVKFAPLWTGVVQALGALASAHEEQVWPPLEAHLKAVMERLPDVNVTPPIIQDKYAWHEHHRLCLNWESSGGKDYSVFLRGQFFDFEGQLSRHDTTDSETVMEFAWQVIQQNPQLLAKRSRVLVPVFLRFLQDQYFVLHATDPASRELGLSDYADPPVRYSRDLLKAQIVQRRLSSFLASFAVMDGPQQMVKHELLKSIFVAFLSHYDARIASLALSSYMQYKPPYAIPYAGQIKEILKKDSLRESLLRFGDAMRSGKVDSGHRQSLVPILSRILFGRISSRVKAARSSKDTPAARRSAILAFLSTMCQNEAELFPFMYLMTRSFIPSTAQLRPLEQYNLEDRRELEKSLLSKKCVLELPCSIYDGYLNLLGAVIAQLGYRAVSFVPQYTSVVLAICELTQVKKADDDEKVTDGSLHEADKRNRSLSRYGAIRSLCFTRLSDLFAQFAPSVNFEPFVDNLWTPLRNSIDLLPSMAAKSENIPALLLMLRTMSRQPRCVALLARNQPTIQAVINCISGTSAKSVVMAALEFVENLLSSGTSDGGDVEHVGRDLIQKEIPLLIKKLTLRLRDCETHRDPSIDSIVAQGGKSSTTWRRELDILYQTSELITDDLTLQWEDKTQVLESMCKLLVPFLESRRMTAETDKLNVLDILKAMTPRVRNDVALATFSSLSKILAPIKSRQSVSSLIVRHKIASVIECIARNLPQLESVSKKLTKLSAIDAKRIEQMDYDIVIPELNSLCDVDGWLSLCEDSSSMPLLPIVATCFHFLYGDDGVVSRAAFNALKALVATAATRWKPNKGIKEDDASDSWAKTVESSIIPNARSGLNARSTSIRRHFILIIAEISRSFRGQDSPQLHGDLWCLIRDDNLDLDFFVNVTHVQLHRQAKAFQRLRKHLNENCNEAAFSQQTLSSVLLPLAMHPAYESKTKSEETLTLEAIATVGVICRHLSWTKYSGILWTTLTQLDRHPEQERYLISVVCTIIDGFHFDVGMSKDNENHDPCDDVEDSVAKDEPAYGSAVWRALLRRIVPRIEGLLVKEKLEREGSRTKTLRPTIALALMKLFQKFPTHVFESRLTRLVTVLCDALKNKDSDAREIARKTMARMVVSMDMKYLADVVRELAITLTEGYYLHVRSAAVHNILLELQGVYKPSAPASDAERTTPYLDKCSAGIMDLLQEDLFGEAKERRETNAHVRYVKEAGGSKSVHSIEILSRLITFKPSETASGGAERSSIHSIVSPLLERLRLATADSTTVRKIREILHRVVVGLTHNSSVTPQELLPYVYATVHPSIGADPLAFIVEKVDDGGADSDDEDGQLMKLKVSGSSNGYPENQAPPSGKGVVVEWRPSTLMAAKTLKDVRDGKQAEYHKLARVQDGASAPKLTGSYRYAPAKVASALEVDDHPSNNAVFFGLNLLGTWLKKAKVEETESLVSMLDPFLPLLTACLCHARDTNISLISLKCVVGLLRFNLPSLLVCSKALGKQTLRLLSTLGASSHQNNDVTQACFKTLTHLINLDANQPGKGANGEEALSKGSRMPLDSEQMQVLISILKVSLAEAEQHNPAYGLIKALVSRRYLSPEFYDLMETMLKMSVRSQKASIREQSSGIFIRYLLNFPMGEERFEDHTKQIVLNFKYDYQDGRISAMNLASSAIDRLPAPVVEKHARLFFLPLVIQLANDESTECREAAANTLSRLLRRCSVGLLQSFFEYCVRWSKNPGPVQTTSLRIFGLFVESCDKFFKGNAAIILIDTIVCVLNENDTDWEIPYLALLCLEKFEKPLHQILDERTELFIRIIENLVHAHPWVKLVAGRLVKDCLLSIDPESFEPSATKGFLTQQPGTLFQVAKNLCAQLDIKEEEQNQKLGELAIASLAAILPLMHNHPHLCFRDNSSGEEKREPVQWLMTRLSAMAKNKGPRRRGAVFKCYAAFATQHNSIVTPYLELMLEPLHRASVEANNETEKLVTHTVAVSEASADISLINDVLQLLEEKCGSPAVFLRALQKVKARAQEIKEQRKVKAKAEAVTNPQDAAKRKLLKQQRERNRKKRRVEERRQGRGDKAKSRHGD